VAFYYLINFKCGFSAG